VQAPLCYVMNEPDFSQGDGCDVSEALEHLNGLIADGVEYPDAEYLTAKRFRVDADELREAYDTWH